MNILVKRIYDEPTKRDGTRVLADRLWPRGVRKEDAHIDAWEKDITPSGELRSWFHEDPKRRYATFATKYQKELSSKKALGRGLIQKAGKTVTLVTAVKDIPHSHIPTLVAFLKKL